MQGDNLNLILELKFDRSMLTDLLRLFSTIETIAKMPLGQYLCGTNSSVTQCIKDLIEAQKALLANEASEELRELCKNAQIEG